MSLLDTRSLMSVDEQMIEAAKTGMSPDRPLLYGVSQTVREVAFAVAQELGYDLTVEKEGKKYRSLARLTAPQEAVLCQHAIEVLESRGFIDGSSFDGSRGFYNGKRLLDAVPACRVCNGLKMEKDFSGLCSVCEGFGKAEPIVWSNTPEKLRVLSLFVADYARVQTCESLVFDMLARFGPFFKDVGRRVLWTSLPGEAAPISNWVLNVSGVPFFDGEYLLPFNGWKRNAVKAPSVQMFERLEVLRESGLTSAILEARKAGMFLRAFFRSFDEAYRYWMVLNAAEEGPNPFSPVLRMWMEGVMVIRLTKEGVICAMVDSGLMQSKE